MSTTTRSQKRNRDYARANAFINKQRKKNPKTTYSGRQAGGQTWRCSSHGPPNAPCLQKIRHKFVPITKATPQMPVWFDEMRSRSKRVAGGGYGTVYEMSRSDANTLLKEIRKLSRDGGHTGVARLVPPGKRVAMKLSDISDEDESIIAYQEVQTLRALKGLRFVPTFYGSARFVDRSPQRYTRVYQVVVMSLVDGKQLESAVLWGRARWLQHPYDMEKVQRRLNSALIQLWKRGILHTDLHTNNILVTKESNVYIIDFGFAIQSPWLKKLASRFSTTDDAVVLWKKYIEPSANLAVRENRRKYYNPNGKVLALLRSNEFQRPRLRNIDVPATATIKRLLNMVKRTNPKMTDVEVKEFINDWAYKNDMYPPLRAELTNRIMNKYRK